jgi:carbamoyltransferase
MRHVGFSEYFHDAGIAIVTEQGNIEFATHAERYTKVKFDPRLCPELADMVQLDDKVTYYEDPQLRREKYEKMGMKNLNPYLEENKNRIMGGIYSIPFEDYISHHHSHAANGFFTRPWESSEDTVIMTVDGIGEFESHVIYNHKFEKLHRWIAPKSLGLTYTKITKLLGLRSMEDEFVTMGLSCYGEPRWGDMMYEWFNSLDGGAGNTNPVNKKRPWLVAMQAAGVDNPEVQKDMAASVQYMTEKVMHDRAKLARKYGSKLILTGGVAQNIICASQIRPRFDDMWIPIAPTDAGSSLGAAAWSYFQATGKDRINWVHPYLGYDIKGEINPKEVVDYLMQHKVCGIANGRAEFGPRALGNRSLIADARFDVKDTVNTIKRRQKYRPFAPAILEEFADQYFEGYMNEYMQYQCKALHDYKSVTHVDGTARVQIVKKDSQSVIRKILEEYYERTKVPLLLNTSLNIRGQPMVNDERDARLFEQRYNVKVF